MSGEQNFWSRRRAAVEAEEAAEQAALEEQALSEQQAALEEKTDEELLVELNLPDPDSLKMGDDFTVFMSKAVPDRLRRRALRTLWRSNPTLANVDMLVDYGEDFTDSAMVIENMQTAYQVGKGMLKHVQEMARQAEERENPADPEIAPVEDEIEQEEELIALNEDLDAQAPPPLQEAETMDGPEDEPYNTPTPRRMKFRAEETV